MFNRVVCISPIMNRQPTGICPVCLTASLELLQHSTQNGVNKNRETWYIRCGRECGYTRIEYVPKEAFQ